MEMMVVRLLVGGFDTVSLSSPPFLRQPSICLMEQRRRQSYWHETGTGSGIGSDVLHQTQHIEKVNASVTITEASSPYYL